MLKKQDKTSGGDQSTHDDTSEMQSITAVKDKQIDLLSSMLAQKEVDMKK